MIVVVICDIVDVDSSSKVDNKIQCFIKAVMNSPPVLDPFLVSRVQDDVLNHGPFLIVNQTQVEGIFTYLMHDIDGMGETVSDSHSLQSSYLVLSLRLLQLQLPLALSK